MDKLLVVGVETTVGANLAAWLAPRYEVIGLAGEGPPAIAGCRTSETDFRSADQARDWIAAERPQWVVHCGAAAASSWGLSPAEFPRAEAVPAIEAWARAAGEFACELTVVSSDAIFTGPWMFHREGGTCYCDSHAAKVVRLMEKGVMDVCPTALLVRSNVFGWSPRSESPGLVETVLTAADERRELSLDCTRHATPILATDFADVLERAYRARLRGVYHLGGGERTNPFRFGCLLADEFGLPLASLSPAETPSEQRRAYGAGETSLQCRRLRKALEVPLPMLRDGLSRLHEQRVSGYCERFGQTEPALAELVA